jgi:D-alanyl-D-alanine carboxypeptidase
LSEGELLTALRRKLDEESTAGRFSGAALLARNGKTVFAQAYGVADREKKTPNTLKTRFRLGSMNKMFTAVATLQLVQSGKLDLKAPFGKYLTDYPNKDVASKVTIEQLLSHTGATGDIFGPEFDKHRLELKTLQDYVNLYGNRALEFEPGSRWQYSNYGFLLLGVLIEKVSGQSYYDYVRDQIYKPAGMTGTASEPEEQMVAERSIGYTRFTGGAPSPNTDTLPYRGTSAGGGYSTVEDLLRFASALQTNKLLNAQNTEMLTTGKVDTPGGKYAYGFGDANINGTRCFGHGGGAPGMNGELKICPGPGYVVAVLANMDPPAASRVADFITNRLPMK